MAKVHILKADKKGNYQVVIHEAMPGGNNSAGKSWSDCLNYSGEQGSTVMIEGLEVGQITIVEKNAIEAFTTIEIVTSIRNDGMNLSGLDKLVNKAIAEYIEQKQLEYKEYGREYTPA